MRTNTIGLVHIYLSKTMSTFAFEKKHISTVFRLINQSLYIYMHLIQKQLGKVWHCFVTFSQVNFVFNNLFCELFRSLCYKNGFHSQLLFFMFEKVAAFSAVCVKYWYHSYVITPISISRCHYSCIITLNI